MKLLTTVKRDVLDDRSRDVQLPTWEVAVTLAGQTLLTRRYHKLRGHHSKYANYDGQARSAKDAKRLAEAEFAKQLAGVVKS